jgi:hypothetical protein
MGARHIRRKNRGGVERGDGRTLGLILAGVGAPMFLGYCLIAMDTHPDLSDGQPHVSVSNPVPVPLGWPSLRVRELRISDREENRPKNGTLVKMLGYMMDGYHYARSGTAVPMFILMAEAGHFLHPAHRIPDEMVEVWPKAGGTVFHDRELVWACGKFESLTNAAAGNAIYALREAVVMPASYQEIAGWFAP